MCVHACVCECVYISRIMYNIYIYIDLPFLYVSSTNWRFISNNNLNGNLTATLILALKLLEPDQSIVSAVSVPARDAFFQICRLSLAYIAIPRSGYARLMSTVL